MAIIKPSTAFKQSADWVSGEVRAYMRDQVATHVDTVQDVRDNDFEQTRFIYVRTKAATYRLDLSSGAADDGDTVLRDNVGRRYVKVAGSGSAMAWDVQVDDLAARAAYDGEVEGFSVLVADIGDGRAAVYERIGAAGNWTDPAFFSGPEGPAGPAGDGFNPAGAWAIETTYSKNDMVSHGGRSFVSFADGNIGNEPPSSDSDDAFWQFVPAAVGPANTLTIGTVDVGPAAASITGDAPNQTLNLTIPQGPAGNDGNDGAAATIAVGTVTTVNPGDPATVTNVGTSAAAVFDFEIPKGQDGTGTGDVVGPAGASDGHAVVFDGATGKLIKSAGKAPFSGDYGDLNGKPTLGSAAAEDTGAFATAAQGGKADSALQPDEDADLAAGFTATSKSLGNLGSVVTISPAGGNIQHGTNTEAVTITAPSVAGVYTIIVEIVNSATAGAVTLAGFTKVDGDSFSTTDGEKFQVHIAKTNSAVTATVKALQ